MHENEEMHLGRSCIDIAKCDTKALAFIRRANKIHNDNFVHHLKIACRNDEMIIMIVMHTETKLMNLYGLSFGILFLFIFVVFFSTQRHVAMYVEVRPELIFISNNILSMGLLLRHKMPHDDYDDDGDGNGV